MNLINDEYLLSNAQIFETFDALEYEQLEPKLAVSNYGRLVIYSQKETTIIRKIIQFIKAIFYKIQFVFGIIKIDDLIVQNLKQRVQDFYLPKQGSYKYQQDFEKNPAEDIEVSSTEEIDQLPKRDRIRARQVRFQQDLLNCDPTASGIIV